MDYQFAFHELKQTLIIKLDMLEAIHECSIIASERERLFYKIQGLKIALEDLYRLEKDLLN